MPLLGNAAGFLRGLLRRKRGGTFEISNAGRVGAAAGAGRWRIGHMASAQCSIVVGAALVLNIIGDPTGAVSLTLAWGEDDIAEPLVDTFAAQFEDTFRTLLA
ncbi:hypothetical protein DFH09DRAFT_1092010 [Mycena vulgaris]|nr:hypothetical protein DFH09DRAFT_1092010 [Mycena vulgaris]